jgi:hypothetical protein
LLNQNFTHIAPSSNLNYKQLLLRRILLEVIISIVFILVGFLLLYYFPQLRANNTAPRPDPIDARGLALGWLTLLIMIRQIVLVLTDLKGKTTLANWLSNPRPPILFLRAFEEDEKAGEAKSFWGITYEERLVAMLQSLGPVIAIGQRRRVLPSPLGAAKLYIKDEAWQAEVEHLMSVAKLVVIDVSEINSVEETTGIMWEMKTALRQVQPQNLIFSLLSYQRKSKTVGFSNYHTFKLLIESSTKSTLPSMPPIMPLFLYFEFDGTPKFISGYVDPYSSLLLLKRTFRPIFERYGVRLRYWRELSVLIFLLLLYIAAMSIFEVVFVFLHPELGK